MKKLSATLLAGVMASSVCVIASGCGGTGDGGIDKNKTQLYVSYFDAGLGRTWIETLGKNFEEAVASYSFETGKTGVQIVPNYNTRNKGDSFYETLERDEDNIYFTEDVDYVKWSHKFYDVTDIYSNGALTGVDANGQFVYENTPISTKIDSNYLKYLNRGTDSSVYYAVPYYLGLKGINYNIDVWDSYNFYFGKDGAPSELIANAIKNNGDMTAAKASYASEIAKIKNGESSDYWTFVDKNGDYTYNGQKYEVGLSAGPDGKHGTYDDGLPATYEEFYLLMTVMTGKGVTPFIWTGDNEGYADMLTTSLWQNEVGVDELNTFYSLNGTVDSLVKFDSNGKIVKEGGVPVLESHTFDGGEDDGYEIQRSVGKYYALSFAEQIASNATWTDSACYDSTSQAAAQTKFLTQGYTASGQKIAMMMDGCWWQQEADGIFEIMEKTDAKYAKENRNFGFMPLPNSSIDRLIERTVNNEKNTITPMNDSYMFINGNLSESSPQLKAAKAFMSYLQSDEALETFVAMSNMLRPVSIEANDALKAKLSPYGRNLLTYLENTNIVYPYTDNAFMNNNRSTFKNSVDGWLWHSYTPTMGEQYYPLTTMHNFKAKGVNAEVYFYGLYNYYRNTAWAQLY